jgi:hypothetical protein
MQATIELAGQVGCERAHCGTAGAGCAGALGAVITPTAASAQRTSAVAAASRGNEKRSMWVSDRQKITANLSRPLS